MSRERAFIPLFMLGLLFLTLAVPATASNTNRSITIGDGIEADGHSTVNGSISVGRAAVINGSLETVNGAITLSDDTRARDVETVNGSIRLGSGVTVDDVSSVNGSIRLAENVSASGAVSVVNGRITTAAGSRIARSVSNVNGEIYLEGTEIGGDLTTVNGDVTLTANSVLNGNLTVEEPSGWNWSFKERRKPRVVIGPGSRVVGRIQLEREVELFISDTASVGGVTGKLSLDDAVRFSGERP